MKDRQQGAGVEKETLLAYVVIACLHQLRLSSLQSVLQFSEGAVFELRRPATGERQQGGRQEGQTWLALVVIMRLQQLLLCSLQIVLQVMRVLQLDSATLQERTDNRGPFIRELVHLQVAGTRR